MSHTANVAAPAHIHKDYNGAKIGMWLFLFTEVLLFGGLFLIYAVYRTAHSHDFAEAAKELNVVLGALNTAVLLTSSLTMALAIACIHRAKKTLALTYLGITILCALVFMVIKYIEWSGKISHGLYPGSEFIMANYSKGQRIYFGLYYSMTGLHALHVIIGATILTVMFYVIYQRPNETHRWDVFGKDALNGCRVAILDKDGNEKWGSEIDESVKQVHLKMRYYSTPKRIKHEDYVSLENSGLYWHIVDVIWIFLFPLMYLIG
ncbi:cytochrome c oxidase subunit 3 family protein [Candidatus Uabimicrobium amorphum]|uniref:Cytochrome oxidase subunit III n=1 Tax=Uabimicrobium amorphum TaxID=2596890 RepID=A0A5S9F6B1_UABAM|nr:cytochrome c oxidase subunit 3 family protein [Candidatus Uabimicrobium amorphum]BBM87003.1 cytochrome oxidase subunit III [Candidatus Uabimicrobium amorphum]